MMSGSRATDSELVAGFANTWPPLQRRWLLYSDVPDAFEFLEKKMLRIAQAERIHDIESYRLI